MGRLFAVPDIHGRLDLLTKLCNRLLTEHNLDLSVDKVIFLGDMIDRGPDSMGVVEFIKSLTEMHPSNVIALAGNHDLMPVMYYGRGKQLDDADLWFMNGGLETLKSYNSVGLTEMSYDHIAWLAKLPLFYEEPGFHFSHAPLPRESFRRISLRGKPYEPDEYVWTYDSDEFGVAKDFGDRIQVVGHVHALRKGILAPRFYGHIIYCDSGCGCSVKAPLVAVEVNTREVIFAWP